VWLEGDTSPSLVALGDYSVRGHGHREDVGVADFKDPNVAPMHGFRHCFKTVGMDAGVSTRVLDAIQGHAARTAGDGYGDVTVKAMAQAMERVQ
jgi:site-specific recombinase XerD